jgi:predicted transcriptional regulator
MSVVSVRVPRDLKDRMSRIQEDWASYLRRMIERRIKEQEMLEASKRIDEIRSKTRKDAYNAARTIREDRDRT